MELVEAIKSRRSIRAYKPDPVPKEVLAQVIDLARHAPSAANNQPWEFIVMTGDDLEKVKRANEEQLRAHVERNPDVPQMKFTGPQRDRQNALGKQMFEIMEIAREDKEKMMNWAATGIRLYDAPAGIIIAMEEEAFNQQICLIDVGTVIQTLALAAVEYGLGTCIQHQWVFYPEVIRKVLDLPQTKRLAMGLATGYPDWDAVANKIQTDREPIDNLTSWRGFA